MDPAMLGTIIGASILVACGAIRMFGDFLQRRRLKRDSMPLYGNPLLVQK